MAMYTKMTATGSSLIVNPRSISKELEAKLAASVARVMAAHDVAALSTKLVRQAVEKDVRVSLANHKDVLKRLMHQEFRKIKAQKVAKRVVPAPWKMATRRESVLRALKRTYQLAAVDGDALKGSALHAIQSLHDLHAAESGPIARLSALYARLLGARWLREKQYEHWALPADPTPAQLVGAVYAVYVVERLGICHPQRVEVLGCFERQPPLFSAKDLLGWDPAVSGPPASDEGSSVYERFTGALFLWYYTDYLGQSVGYSLLQLLQYLPALYPYKGPDELSASAYGDQLTWIVSLVMVLTDFGRLRCEPELLPHEYFLLRQHLVYHIAQQDPICVGETLRALKCFEGSDNLVSVRRGMAFLLAVQRADGTWALGAASSSADDSARTYFATMSALLALSEPKRLGFAPVIPAVAPLLERHLNANIDNMLKAADVSRTERAAQSDSATKSDAGAAAASDSASTDGTPALSMEDLETQVRFQQSLLENEGANVKNVPAKLATHVLSTLAGLTLTVDILKSTGVGRTINKLRKHTTPEVAKAAGQLVAKWKKDLL